MISVFKRKCIKYVIFNNQIPHWFKDESKITWLARFTKFHENSVVINVMLFVFLWLFKTNQHRLSTFVQTSGCGLPPLCLVFLLFFPFCYISTKNVYQVKHGKPQLPKRLEEKHILIIIEITIQQFRPWALPSIYSKNVKQDISFSNLWVTRNNFCYCRTKFWQLLFFVINLFPIY